MVHIIRTDIDDAPWIEAQFGLLDRLNENKLLEFFGWQSDHFSIEANSCHGKYWRAIRNSRQMGLEVASYRYSVGGLVVRFKEGSELYLYTLSGVKLVLEQKNEKKPETVQKGHVKVGETLNSEVVSVPMVTVTAWNHLFALNFDIAKFRFSLAFSKRK